MKDPIMMMLALARDYAPCKDCGMGVCVLAMLVLETFGSKEDKRKWKGARAEAEKHVAAISKELELAIAKEHGLEGHGKHTMRASGRDLATTKRSKKGAR